MKLQILSKFTTKQLLHIIPYQYSTYYYISIQLFTRYKNVEIIFVSPLLGGPLRKIMSHRVHLSGPIDDKWLFIRSWKNQKICLTGASNPSRIIVQDHNFYSRLPVKPVVNKTAYVNSSIRRNLPLRDTLQNTSCLQDMLL